MLAPRVGAVPITLCPVPLVSMRQLLDEAAAGGYGVGAFNVNNMEQIQAVFEAADETRSPVIVQASRGARSYTNDRFLSHLMLAAVEVYPDVPVALHQDHGHRADDEQSSADWEALARLGQPIILYMPMTQLPGIVAALIRGGMAADMPAALLQSATTEDERVLESTLGRLVDDARAQGIGSPAIAVIGAVAGLRRQVLAGLVGWR